MLFTNNQLIKKKFGLRFLNHLFLACAATLIKACGSAPIASNSASGAAQTDNKAKTGTEVFVDNLKSSHSLLEIPIDTEDLNGNNTLSSANTDSDSDDDNDDHHNSSGEKIPTPNVPLPKHNNSLDVSSKKQFTTPQKPPLVIVEETVGPSSVKPDDLKFNTPISEDKAEDKSHFDDENSKQKAEVVVAGGPLVETRSDEDQEEDNEATTDEAESRLDEDEATVGNAKAKAKLNEDSGEAEASKPLDGLQTKMVTQVIDVDAAVPTKTSLKADAVEEGRVVALVAEDMQDGGEDEDQATTDEAKAKLNEGEDKDRNSTAQEHLPVDAAVSAKTSLKTEVVEEGGGVAPKADDKQDEAVPTKTPIKEKEVRGGADIAYTNTLLKTPAKPFLGIASDVDNNADETTNENSSAGSSQQGDSPSEQAELSSKNSIKTPEPGLSTPKSALRTPSNEKSPKNVAFEKLNIATSASGGNTKESSPYTFDASNTSSAFSTPDVSNTSSAFSTPDVSSKTSSAYKSEASSAYNSPEDGSSSDVSSAYNSPDESTISGAVTTLSNT